MFLILLPHVILLVLIPRKYPHLADFCIQQVGDYEIAERARSAVTNTVFPLRNSSLRFI